MRTILAFLGLPFEESVIEYGRQSHDEQGLGDPVSVARRTRPMTKSVDKWVVELLGNEKKLTLVRGIIDSLDKEDLKIWGYPYETIFEPLKSSAPTSVKLKKLPLDIRPPECFAH